MKHKQAWNKGVDPWNKGLVVGPKKHLEPSHVQQIGKKLKELGRVRDLALFRLGIDTMLPGHELVKMKIDDVVRGEYIRADYEVKHPTKDNATFRIPLSKVTQKAVYNWLDVMDEAEDVWLFPGRGRRDGERYMTARQYARLCNQWFMMIGLDPADYGTHSIRRCRAMQAYNASNGNVFVPQICLGHVKPETTMAYLGLLQQDADIERILKQVTV